MHITSIILILLDFCLYKFFYLQTKKKSKIEIERASESYSSYDTTNKELLRFLEHKNNHNKEERKRLKELKTDIMKVKTREKEIIKNGKEKDLE